MTRYPFCYRAGGSSNVIQFLSAFQNTQARIPFMQDASPENRKPRVYSLVAGAIAMTSSGITSVK